MAIEDVTEIVPEVATITPFQKLVLSIGEIPTNYLDSMSYAEQVTWFCMFLQEKVLPVVNQHSEKILEIINYLNNLDLQDEVNNKLDEMTESGQLQEIIADYLNSKAIFGFDTVADMKAATNLIAGSYAQTLGYSNINDTGKALYKIREITNEDVVDNSTIIALNNENLIAELINNEINAGCFAGANDSEKIQNAIDYATKIYNDNTVPISIILDRLYSITTPLDIETNVKRIPFTFTSNSNGGFYKSTEGKMFTTSKTYISDITFNNITFKSNDEAGAFIFESPKFINVKFINCDFKDLDQCTNATSYLQSITFDSCTITGGVGNFIEVPSAYHLNFNNNIIEHRRDSYLIYQTTATTIHNLMNHVILTNNLIEGFTSTSGLMHLINVDTLVFNNNYVESMPLVIELLSISNRGVLTIENNRLLNGNNTNGLLKISENNNQLKFGTINFNNNYINGSYAINFNVENLYSTNTGENTVINYVGNEVHNSYTSTEKYKSLTTNPHFNKLPVYLLTGDDINSIYGRKIIINGDLLISWEYSLTISGRTYNIKASIKNGNYYLFNYYTQTLNTSITEFNFYYGFDIYSDDDVKINCAARDGLILNYFKAGNVNSKYIVCQGLSQTSSGNKAVISKICLNGYSG